MIVSRSVVEEHLAAVASMDGGRIAAGYALDATLTAMGERAEGRDQIGAWFEERASFFTGLELCIERLVCRPDFAGVEWWATLGGRPVEGYDEFDIGAGLITAQRVVRVGSSSRAPRNVRLEFDAPIGRVVLDRDEKRNAVSQSMLATMTTGLAEFAADPAVRAVVIVGAGRDFCASEDVGGFRFQDVSTAEQLLDGPLGFFSAVEELRKPVIIAVHGHALGFGSEMLIAADSVVASPESVFGFVEIDHGAVPSVLMTRGLDSVFRRRAAFSALTGRRFGIEEAVAARLVHVVADDPRAEAEALARELASRPADLRRRDQSPAQAPRGR